MITSLKIAAGRLTNRTLVLPLLIYYPTSRCNSRCVSCDWWKSTGADDLTLDEILAFVRLLPPFGVRVVAFSGGEPLLRQDVFTIARAFRERVSRAELLTSGVLLPRHAKEVAGTFSRVTVSLDATGHELYRRVRGIDALGAVEEGVRKLKELSPALPVTARATLHRSNFRELPALVAKARELGLDGISFLAADVSSLAFGRRHAPAAEECALDAGEIEEMRALIELTIASHSDGFVAESPAKLRRIADYYAALRGQGKFPPVSCNAPWISAVIEANGAVRPCFFHPAVGNVRSTPLPQILRRNLRAFRASLDVPTDSLCRRCVCSMKATIGRNPWS
jgi:MoaA/NifB/PqqE/SkfB family radical SAM enzyme